MKLHRNSFKRIIFEDAVYFVTSKTHNNYPYFKERIFCDLFLENLRMCKRLKGFLLYGWVLNYDHFHLLLQPSDKFNISNVIQFLKRHVSRNLNIILGFGKQTYHHNLIGGIGQSRRQVYEFDIFVRILKSRFKYKFLTGHSFPIFKWQDSFHDNYIRSETDFNNHLDYIEYNPDKHGLPDGWPYIFTNPEYEDLIDENI